jgi:MarR family transcriptional regulator, organic hydroperoxide resistance regulator
MLSIGLGTRLRRLIAFLDGDVQALYDELGVGFRPRFYPIVRLLMVGPATVGELAAGTEVSQPAATQTLQEMRKAGLVQISRGADARSRRVELTAEGRQLAKVLGPVWAAIGRAADRLDQELAHGLSATIDEALEALAETSFRTRIGKAMKA